jgi:hypothetical protein
MTLTKEKWKRQDEDESDSMTATRPNIRTMKPCSRKAAGFPAFWKTKR